MSALHPNLVHQLRVWAHRVGRAAVPDDQPADTLMTDSEATKPRHTLYEQAIDDLNSTMADFIVAVLGCVVLAALVAGWL